jgi:integrase
MHSGGGSRRYTGRRAGSGPLVRALTERIVRAIDPHAASYRVHESKSLGVHLEAWRGSLSAAGGSEKHVDLFTTRAHRVVALLMGASLSEIEPARRARRPEITLAAANLVAALGRAHLSDLTEERVQMALGLLRSEGRSLQTCNHHRAAIRAFSKWCFESRRTRQDGLRAVRGFNAREDPRHERRTIPVGELARLIEAAEAGPVVLGIAGPVRALCYRLAVCTGLRYSEIAGIMPGSFDWKARSVTIAAAYAKNGRTATLPLPGDLAEDLEAFVGKLPISSPVFPLPADKGAELVRVDLAAAGIPYQDDAGQFFDFHALRCEMATLADQAGVSPRVVQRLMRHSTLELTGRYTRPRVADLDAAARKLPLLKTGGAGRDGATLDH